MGMKKFQNYRVKVINGRCIYIDDKNHTIWVGIEEWIIGIELSHEVGNGDQGGLNVHDIPMIRLIDVAKCD